jgi:excisionase family DNA binding protein
MIEHASPYRDGLTGPILLSQRQAAELLGISARTLARRSADGTIPSFLIGRRRVYSRLRLIEWIAERAA